MYRKLLLIPLLILFHTALADKLVIEPSHTPIVVIGNKTSKEPAMENRTKERPATPPDSTPAQPDIQPEPTIQTRRITTLRVEGNPKGQFKKYGARLPTLEKVDIDVRNVGSEVADSVVVSVILPNGQIIPLEGPTSLKRNEKATYSQDIGQQITSNTPLRAKLECTNCRTRQ